MPSYSLGGVSSRLLKGISGNITTTSVLGSDRRFVTFNLLKNKNGIIILKIDNGFSVYSFTADNGASPLFGEGDTSKASIGYYAGNWIAVVYGTTDKTIEYKLMYYDE